MDGVVHVMYDDGPSRGARKRRKRRRRRTMKTFNDYMRLADVFTGL